MGLRGGHKAAALGHEDDEGRLAQEGALTGHVGAREDDDLLLVAVQEDVVGNVFLPCRHQGLDHGMPAFPDVQHLGVVELRTAVVVLQGLLGKTREDIYLGQDAAVGLDVGNLLLDFGDKLRVKP